MDNRGGNSRQQPGTSFAGIATVATAAAIVKKGSKKRRAPPPPAASLASGTTPQQSLTKLSGTNNEAGNSRVASNVPNTLERLVVRNTI